MLHELRRWFSRASSPEGWDAVADWAEGLGHASRPSRERDAVTIEARPPRSWRLEWGQRQRHYLQGPELRIRADIHAAPTMRMLLLTRPLMVELEREVFEEFVEDVRTRADTRTPEEMRWLVLYPKLGSAELKGLREHFAGVSPEPAVMAQWLQGPLAAALEKTGAAWLRGSDPLLLMVHRDRLTLRTTMARVDAGRLQAMVALFELALAEVRRLADHWHMAAGSASTTPALWTRSELEDGAERDD